MRASLCGLQQPARPHALRGQRTSSSRTTSLPNRASRPLRLQAVASFGCPYAVLGLSAGASDSEVKAAFRRQALKLHPDVCKEAGAEARFVSLQQAYEIITKKGASGSGGSGNSGSNSGPDWEFHDWYWSFMQRRRWRSHKRGAAPGDAEQPPSGGDDDGDAAGPHQQHHHQQPQDKAAIRTQLAGLRHRAAIRATKRQPTWGAAAPAAAAGTSASSQPQQAQPAAPQQQPPPPPQEPTPSVAQSPMMASLDIDSSEMSDGCNMASGVTDWDAAAQAHAAAAARKRFAATESRRKQVMAQVAGLHRMAHAASSSSAGGGGQQPEQQQP